MTPGITPMHGVAQCQTNSSLFQRFRESLAANRAAQSIAGQEPAFFPNPIELAQIALGGSCQKLMPGLKNTGRERRHEEMSSPIKKVLKTPAATGVSISWTGHHNGGRYGCCKV
jgi:hypothetical protein